MDRREIELFLHAIRQARASGEPAAIATIVRVRGSAYRREGTHMLIRPDGTYECALSGGCLEPSVADAALRVIETGEPVLVNYDLADDSLWGLGMGCSGAIDVHIERLDDLERDEAMREWLTILERGDRAALVTPLSGASGRLIIRPNGEHTGRLSDPSLEEEAVTRATARLRAVVPHSGPESIGNGELFFEVSVPAPELVVFGAGPDAAPLAQHAWALGFSVTMVDVRTAYLTKERFPTAKLVLAHFSQFATAVPLAPGSLVIVMNHHLERDEESLRYALDSDAAFYIGVLGPRPRYEKLLAGLAARGYTPSTSRLARVHSPVGLSIGAETPEEVAVSVLAELVAVGRGFEGGFLSGSSRSLHTPEDKRLLTSS
jgi:xanthine/CO dehydrogenase XdhC/CoxF family maturation factor